MVAKDKKNPYREVAESLHLDDSDDKQSFDSSDQDQENDATFTGTTQDGEAEFDIENKISELNDIISGEKDKNLRLQAELENVRKRSINDISNARKYAIESFATSLLAVADSLETALGTEEQTNAQLLAGVELTLKQLRQAFERANLETVMPEIGEKFDPNWHQAVSTKSIDEIEGEHVAGVIFEVLQKGYKISGRVIRPAVVVVTG